MIALKTKQGIDRDLLHGIKHVFTSVNASSILETNSNPDCRSCDKVKVFHVDVVRLIYGSINDNRPKEN